MTEQVLDSIASSEQPEPTPGPKASFADLGLRQELLKAVADMGFTEPMEVQQKTIPLVREGRDILVQSRTGSGKTAAFAIPFADWIADSKLPAPQALVLLPTRELALQVAAETARICATSPLSVVPVYGGSPMGRQIEQLRAGAHIVCGTPGRTLDHIRRGTLRLDKIRCVVLDECDEMLSMGFQEDIEAILSETPSERQTLLFSATIPEGIQRLSRRYMRSPETLKLSADFVGVHEIRHTYYSIPGGQREAELVRILAFEEPERAVIFCNTREETGRVAEHLRRQGMNAEPISSDLSQSEREEVMSRMRAGNLRFLVATDVAARGIDIENLPCVINYTFPESPESYIHRTGRTGRAGKSGHAISLIGPTEVGSFYYLKLLYKIRPEERSLPSEAEVRSHREGERLAHLRGLFPGDPGPEWHSLARRLMTAIDAERLVGSLLRGALGPAKSDGHGQPRPALAASPAKPPESQEPTAAPQASEPERRERGTNGERRGGRGYGERERAGRGRGDRERDRAPRASARSARPSAGPERAQPPAEDTRRAQPPAEDTRRAQPPAEDTRRAQPPAEDTRRAQPPAEDTRRAQPPAEDTRRAQPPAEDTRRAQPPAEDTRRAQPPAEDTRRAQPPAEDTRRAHPSAEDTREFWEVWSEEVGRTPGQASPTQETAAGEAASASTEQAVASASTEQAVASASTEQAGSGSVRLYVNLGRKDGVTPEVVAQQLSASGMVVSPSDIELMNTHSYLNVPREVADTLCSKMNGQLYNGRAIVVEAARPPRRR